MPYATSLKFPGLLNVRTLINGAMICPPVTVAVKQPSFDATAAQKVVSEPPTARVR